MSVQGKRDLEGLREAGRVVRACLREMSRRARPGVSTADLNRVGAEVMKREGARSAPMAVYRFPAETCISVNDEIVHGIPSARALREGDLVKLDVTVEKGGYVADAAITVAVGAPSRQAAALIDCARRAFYLGIAAARAGNPVSAIGRAVEQEVSRCGFSVVRELTGHGTGRTIHEAPIIPNHYDPAASQPLTPGLVIAVEPLIAAGAGGCREAADGWTIVTADGSPAAHYEHTHVITEDDPILMTAAA